MNRLDFEVKRSKAPFTYEYLWQVEILLLSRLQNRLGERSRLVTCLSVTVQCRDNAYAHYAITGIFRLFYVQNIAVSPYAETMAARAGFSLSRALFRKNVGAPP